MSGPAIAAQVEKALVQAARATGTGTYLSVLRKRNGDLTYYYDLKCVMVNKKSFDAMQMVQRTNKTLLVNPIGVVPKKGDHVGVGFTEATKDDVTHWARISSVDEVIPAGTVLLYRLKLEE